MHLFVSYMYARFKIIYLFLLIYLDQEASVTESYIDCLNIFKVNMLLRKSYKMILHTFFNEFLLSLIPFIKTFHRLFLN